MLRGVCGATEPAGGEGVRAPELLGFPAELALTSGDEKGTVLFTGARGLGDSCSSCACTTGMRSHSSVDDLQSVHASHAGRPAHPRSETVVHAATP